MKIVGLNSFTRIKKYKSNKRKQGKIAPNVLEHNLKTNRPDKNRQQTLPSSMSLDKTTSLTNN